MTKGTEYVESVPASYCSNSIQNNRYQRLKNGPQAYPGDKLVGFRGPIWWAAYTTHMLRVSLVYILIYGSILEIHEY